MSVKDKIGRREMLCRLRMVGVAVVLVSLVCFPYIGRTAWVSTKPAQTDTVSQGMSDAQGNFAAIEAGTATIAGTQSATFAIEGATANAFECIVGTVDPTADRTHLFPNDAAAAGDVVCGSAANTLDYVGLANTNILIGDGAGAPAAASISGDGSMTNAGVLSISDLTISSEAQGDILYFNGSNWVRLAAGTNEYFLKTSGASANPSWAVPVFNPTSTLEFYDDFCSMSDDSGAVAGGAAARIVSSKYNYVVEGAYVGENAGVDGKWVVEGDGTRNGFLFLADGSGTAATDAQFPFKAASNLTFYAGTMKTGGNAETWIGLGSTAPDGTAPTNGIWFNWTNAGNIYYVCNDADGNSSTDSGVAVSSVAIQDLKAVISSSSVVFTINGGDSHTETDDIPTDNLTFFATSDSTTDGRGLELDYWDGQQSRQ